MEDVLLLIGVEDISTAHSIAVLARSEASTLSKKKDVEDADINKIVDGIIERIGADKVSQKDAESLFGQVSTLASIYAEERNFASDKKLGEPADVLYMAAGGEVESRMIEARLGLTDEQRKDASTENTRPSQDSPHCTRKVPMKMRIPWK